MAIDVVRDYLSTQLPLELNAQQHFSLLRTVFILVFASTIVIHLLIGQDDSLATMLIHATFVGLAYTVAVGLATAVLYALRGTVRYLHVWHLWAASLAGFILGYYFLPFDDFVAWFPSIEAQGHGSILGFPQLLPIWFLVTYLIVHSYLNEGLRAELARVREINLLLEGDNAPTGRSDRPVRFEAGKTVFTLNANKIINIAVDDHYCYVHFQRDGGFGKRDLAMPLRDVVALLPADFVQVHRSHVVNLQHIASIVRKNRRIFVVLDSRFEVPVSRHRLEEVLPLLRQRVAPRPN